jgi:hypothetical protein
MQLPFMPMPMPPPQQQQEQQSKLQAVLAQLGRDQQKAVDAVLKGHSVFLTGLCSSHLSGCCQFACT